MMGSIFALVPPSTTGGAWKQVSLYSFTGPFADGDYPAAALIHGKNGSLYGTTEYGGTSDSGTVFELKF